MHVLKVGELYHPTRTSWPEQADFNILHGGLSFRLFLKSPTALEVASVAKGKANFFLLVEQPLILLGYRFDSAIPWSDTPLSMHLVRENAGEAAAELPALVEIEGKKPLVQVLLIDAMTGRLRAMRALTVSPEFSLELFRGAHDQLKAPWNPQEFDAKHRDVYRRYPTSQSLYAAALTTSQGLPLSKGGD